MLYDVEISADYMDYFAGLVTEIKGSTIPIDAGTLNYTLREPLGVVGRIGAFNHPLLFTAGKCGAPLVTGNTLVVKPADQTPLTSLRIAELWNGVFPPGRVQRRDRRPRRGRRAGRASEGREDRLHRQRARRPRGDERRERDAQGADAGTGRQERADRVRGRGAGRRRRRRRARDEFPLRHRAVVQFDQPRLSA